MSKSDISILSIELDSDMMVGLGFLGNDGENGNHGKLSISAPKKFNMRKSMVPG